jgi:hypothetical protein
MALKKLTSLGNNRGRNRYQSVGLGEVSGYTPGERPGTTRIQATLANFSPECTYDFRPGDG